MKWLLIYAVFSQTGGTPGRIEADTREDCERKAIALLESSAKLGLRVSAVCHNTETGEGIEIKLPNRPTA